MRRKLPYLFVSLAVVVLDQWTKWLVELHLPRGVSQPVDPGRPQLRPRRTPVSLSASSLPTAASSSLMLTWSDWARWRSCALLLAHARHDRLLLTALGLVAGGAVGNLVDRVAPGAR